MVRQSEEASRPHGIVLRCSMRHAGPTSDGDVISSGPALRVPRCFGDPRRRCFDVSHHALVNGRGRDDRAEDHISTSGGSLSLEPLEFDRSMPCAAFDSDQSYSGSFAQMTTRLPQRDAFDLLINVTFDSLRRVVSF
jgi:hypothetical protein